MLSFTPLISAIDRDPIWSSLKQLPSAGDDGDGTTIVNDCLQPLWETANPLIKTVQCSAHGWNKRPKPKPGQTPRRVFDMFIVNNEIDMMEARMHELDSLVDVFVVVEASMTHQGRWKSSMVKPHWKARFKRFAHKVIHVWVDIQFDCRVWPWACENYQREKMLQGFVHANGQPDDVVLISDVDEFPRPEYVHALQSCDFDSRTRQRAARVVLGGHHFWYSGHCRRTDAQWEGGPTAATGRSLMLYGAHQIRRRYTGWGRPGRRGGRKTDRGNTKAGWKELSQSLPAGEVRDDAHAAYLNGSLTTRPFMAYMEPAEADLALHAALVKLQHLRKRGMRTQLLTNSSWHFSYFMTPEQIALKYRSANVGRLSMEQPPSFHFEQAMQCGSPQHATWRFEYVPHLTDNEVPIFVLRNRCRMRIFFRYSRSPGAWLANDYAPKIDGNATSRVIDEGNASSLPRRGMGSNFSNATSGLPASALCKSGRRSDRDVVCCEAACSFCGGPGCSLLGRPGQCCASKVLRRGRNCLSPDDTGCVLQTSDSAASGMLRKGGGAMASASHLMPVAHASGRPQTSPEGTSSAFAFKNVSGCCPDAVPEPGVMGRCLWMSEQGKCAKGRSFRTQCPVACGVCSICHVHPMRAAYNKLWSSRPAGHRRARAHSRVAGGR